MLRENDDKIFSRISFVSIVENKNNLVLKKKFKFLVSNLSHSYRESHWRCNASSLLS